MQLSPDHAEAVSALDEMAHLPQGDVVVAALAHGFHRLGQEIQMDPPQEDQAAEDIWLQETDRPALLAWSRERASSVDERSSSAPLGPQLAALADFILGRVAKPRPRAALRSLISTGLGGSFPRWADSDVRSNAPLLGFAQEFLIRTGPTGVIATETLPFMNDQILSGLAKEALRSRTIAERVGPQVVGPPGPVATNIHQSHAMREWLSSAVQTSVYPDLIGGYLFYENTEDYLYPHFDRLRYPINVVLSVSMESHEPDRSGTMVVEGVERIRKVNIHPGQALAFYASNTIHGRDPLLPGEKVCILSLGFGLAA